MANSSRADQKIRHCHGQLDMSHARECGLKARYAYILDRIDERQARTELTRINCSMFRDVVMRVDDFGVVVGADAVLPRDLALEQPRFGLTLVLPGRRPLIWVNLLKHDSAAELADTICHEAIHATVRLLRRHLRTPQPDELIAYHAEEIVALSGTNTLLSEMGFPVDRQIERNLANIESCKRTLNRAGCDERFLQRRFVEAEAAVGFLMEDHLIGVEPPTLEEVRDHGDTE